jgi:hypothetical protein
MRTFILLGLLSLLSLVACNTKAESNDKYPLGSFELGGPSGKDTLNIIDGNKLKQGLWIMRNTKDTMVYRNDTGYSTKGHTFGEVQRMLKSGGIKLFVCYDSLAVKSE